MPDNETHLHEGDAFRAKPSSRRPVLPSCVTASLLDHPQEQIRSNLPVVPMDLTALGTDRLKVIDAVTRF